jgi:acetylornithine deacetylase/succinyl-diaminopimelate desuccinylase-like protein
MPQARIDMLEEIRTLCALPPRLAGSEGERLAHEHVAETLARLGLDPEVEEFRAPGNANGRIALHAAMLAAAGTVGVAAPSLGAVLSAGANLSFLGDLEGRWVWLSRVLPYAATRNVVARLPPAGTARRRVVLMAHVDVAREAPGVFFEPSRARAASRFFRDKLGSSPNPVQLLFWAGVAQTGLAAASGVGLPTQPATWALAQLHAWTAVTVGRSAFGPPVPGASDNASGVAVLLALADRLTSAPLPRTEVWFVATGCEESFLAGAADLLERHATEFAETDTWFLAIDTLGSGALRYCTEEGFVRRVAYDPEFVALAAATAAEPGTPPVRPFAMRFGTDALVPTVRGHRAMSLIALDDDDYAPNYHWRTDTPDTIDPATPAAAVDFTMRLLRRVDAVP